MKSQKNSKLCSFTRLLGPAYMCTGATQRVEEELPGGEGEDTKVSEVGVEAFR